MPSSTEHLAPALARARRAALLATQLGLALGEESPDAPGLPVETVEEGSPGARAGILAGDRLVAIDGVRVHAMSDLLPPSGASRATLELARAGEASTFEVRLPLSAAREEVSSRELYAAQAALAWALLVLLLVAPSAALLEWATHRAPPAPPASRALTALRALIAIVCFACVAALDAAGLLRVPLELVLAFVLAARTGAACVGAASRWERLRAIGAPPPPRCWPASRSERRPRSPARATSPPCRRSAAPRLGSGAGSPPRRARSFSCCSSWRARGARGAAAPRSSKRARR
ncbi:MAG: PDZ domain-containing protein [Sandaracinaceae bacterium]|nr:PDZ domain-containing protein [Sandaracinaceae bacterium]